MYFLDTYPKYYIVSADFEAHPELSLQEKSRLVIEEYQNDLRAYYQKNEMNPPLASAMSRYFIILWRNLPKTNIDDNTEDTLFEMMCRSITENNFPNFQIYIKDINVLANNSIERFIKRLCMLKKCYNPMPIFLDSTTSMLQLSKFGSMPAEDFLDNLTQFVDSAKEYNTIINFLENIYTSVKKESVETVTKGFIHYYYEIQKSNMVIADIIEQGNMTRRTLYRYFDEFEQHPFFPEYCKLFPSLINKHKKRPLSFDLKEFHKDATKLFFTKEIKTLANDENLDKDLRVNESLLCAIANMEIDDLLEKYSLTCSIDAYRTWLAVKKKLKIK